MYSEFNLMHLDAEKRKLYMQQGARARLLKRIRAGQPGFKCYICEKLAAFFLGAAEKIKAMAEIKPGAELPPAKSEDLRRLLESATADGLFI